MLEKTLKARKQEPYTSWTVKHPALSNKSLLRHEGWITERDAESVQVILWLCSGCWWKAYIFKCFQDYRSLAAGSESFWAAEKVMNIIGNYLQLLQNLFWKWKLLWAVLWLLGSFRFCFYRNALPTPAQDFAMIGTAASHEDNPQHHLKKASKQSNKLQLTQQMLKIMSHANTQWSSYSLCHQREWVFTRALTNQRLHHLRKTRHNYYKLSQQHHHHSASCCQFSSLSPHLQDDGLSLPGVTCHLSNSAKG